jgi:16S rRNA (guanine527-N7)-methyltransferase
LIGRFRILTWPQAFVTDSSTFQALAGSLGCEISSKAAQQLLDFLAMMLEENRRINLTSVRDMESAVLFHALDSVAIAGCGLDKAPVHVLDIGTGNGFPGVAVACLYPEAKVLLLDRTLKKLKAIERALLATGFDCERVQTTQMDAAEAHAHGHREKFDLVTARAVGPPSEIARLANPLLAPGGNMITWLSEETEAPQTLRGALRKREEFKYTLPAPASRVRRLVRYGV